MPHVPPQPGNPQHGALRMARQGDFAQAVAALERSLAGAAGSDERQQIATTLASVARLAEEADDVEQAQAALELGIRAADWADLHCRLGCLLLRRGRRTDARRSLERALAINPRYRAAIVERALLDAGEGRIAEAMETLRLLASEGSVERRTFQQGMERLGHAEFDDAAPLLRRALNAGDAWLDEQMRSYQELILQDDMAGALQVLRAAVTEHPSYPDLHLLLGGHELRMGATDDAVESLSYALELHPDFHAARIELARALETLGESPQAIRQLELVLEHDPGNAQARHLHERLTSRHRVPRGGAVRASNRS